MCYGQQQGLYSTGYTARNTTAITIYTAYKRLKIICVMSEDITFCFFLYTTSPSTDNKYRSFIH